MPLHALIIAALHGCGGCADGPVSADSAPDSAACTPETPETVDWMAAGAFDIGVVQHSGETELGGLTMPLDVQLNYPASSDGALASGGPFPVVYFEHAYGADYQNSDWLLERLASRGFVVLSAGHNGAWDGAGDWWGDHAALFEATAALAEEWDADAESVVFGGLDFGTTALMGHSHGGGAALEVMDVLDPDAVVLITVRPNLDGNYGSYHDRYDGMAPMLNIVASRDEDSTTAYGTSIAVYEALTRPRFMVTVEGASHYTFTDEANINASNITRESGQIVGGSAIIAFLEYRLRGDRRGLHALTGDAPLSGSDGAPIRTQVHLDGALVLDDFENAVSAEGVAIAGIEGQTFVNGFMGDTFVDFDAGVDLLIAEIEALSQDGDRVLFYQDASRSTDAYAVALAELDRELVSVVDKAEFALALDQDWELVVATQQDGNSSDVHVFDEALAAWICDGGKVIISDFRINSSGAQDNLDCAGAVFDGTYNFSTMSSQSGLFDGELRLQNPGWGIYSTGLQTNDTIFATNNTVSEGIPDPAVGPLGAVIGEGLSTFEAISALDSSRYLSMPTQALEVAWDGSGSVQWSFDEPVDASGHGVLSVRMLQIHDDPLNQGDVEVQLAITDVDGGTAQQSLTVGGTMDWLETTVPKSVFETFRLPLEGFDGVDLGRIASVELGLSGSGRLLIDDLELSPGLVCE